MKDNELTVYMNTSIRKLISDAFRSAASNPAEALFLLGYAASNRQSVRRRAKYEKEGIHIPPFLISSITSNCNLFCAGCYARANQLCAEAKPQKTMPASRWSEIFGEAQELGIAFILLAGGEPLLNREVLVQAASKRRIIFPVFTNGTLMGEDNMRLFRKNRNLIPIISLEGNPERTDLRRGVGTSDKISGTMDRLKSGKILYGVSITVTRENLQEVASDDFIARLHEKRCGIVFFIEYVPVAEGTAHLAPGDDERAYLETRQNALRTKYKGMIFLSFPGDEKYTGGCLAAGRGFFHIDPSGNVEPCPFSPYSDTNMRTGGLLDALRSPLFQKLRQLDLLGDGHDGGCSLFAREEEVRKICGESER